MEKNKTDICNIQDEIISEMVADIQKKREIIIFTKLGELGIVIDIKEERERRFKSLAIEYKNNEETIYYNDGSVYGLRVVTFVTREHEFDYEKMSISCETTFY